MLYDPVSNVWLSAGQMSVGRSQGAGATLPNGLFVLSGGGSSGVDVYNPFTGSWSSSTDTTVRTQPTATLTGSGAILITGGLDAGFNTLSSTELFTSFDAQCMPGACNPQTGTCDGPSPNGTPCSDGDACLQTQSCQSGYCVASNPVTCAAGSTTCQAKECNPSTGTCASVPVANGDACNDGNLCMVGETCQAGTCTGTPVSCAPTDSCHAAGTCDPTTGACTNAELPDGTSCPATGCFETAECKSGVCTGVTPVVCPSEGGCLTGTCIAEGSTHFCFLTSLPNGASCSGPNACDTYTCVNSTCTATGAVTCAPPDQCHSAGSCNPATGTCSYPPVADGTFCFDGNQCDISTCQAGVCTLDHPYVCPAPDACHTPSTCNPSTGECSPSVPLPDLTPCSDGNACHTDFCNGGVCEVYQEVRCSSIDQCHNIGTCDPATGQCSNPEVPNGTQCNDNNACTHGDQCIAGTCTPGAATVCNPLDICHLAGTCDPTTGACSNPDVVCTASDSCHVAGSCRTDTGGCSNPVAPDGTSCPGSNLCDQTYQCKAGTCSGSNPVVCPFPDEPCRVAGACNPSTGTCGAPAIAPDGTGCESTNKCMQTSVCSAGACVGSNPVQCSPSDQCHVAGTCDPSTGGCSNPLAANGTSCNDGNACTQSDSCQAGTCTGTAVTCTPPDACHSATCNSATGACSSSPLANGTPCGSNDAGQPLVCTNGSCGPEPSCNPAQALCNGVCVSLQSDPNNCGACGKACPAGYACAAGSCMSPGALHSCAQNTDVSLLQTPDGAAMYVPIGGFGAGSAAGAVQRLLFEGNVVKSFTTIPTPHAVNACASNWVTGQTVCTSDLTDVYVIQGTTLVATLTDGALGTITFSGGPTQSSGVVIDATTNTAVIGVSAPAPGGIASGGFQLLDLDTNTFSAPMTNGRDSVSGFGLLPSEAFVIDPTRHFVLSASEDSGDIQLVPYQSGPPPSLSAPFDNWNFAPYVYEGQNLGYQSWDSTAEDCTTGIGLAGTEENGANVTLVDTTQATFTSGTPKGTWSAPTSTTNFTELGATFGGLTGITVISEQHQALMFTAEGGSGGATLVAVQLPSTAGYGTPAPVDWADILNTFDSSGSPFNIGSDPHPGTTGYVDPKTGHSLVVLLSGTGKYITVDLQLLLDAPRQPGSHFVDPSYDLYLHGVLSYGAYCSGFDTKSDPNNCGGCDVVCPAGANALAVCSAAVCGIACQAGFADCANTHTACATNVETDLANCGSCGTNCNVPNSVGACNGGQCSFTCNAGYNDCDGNASNGCETLGACVAPTVGVSGPTSAVVGVVSYYSATATDTGRPLTYAWTQTSGPSPADFGTPSALTTTVDFLAPGTYVLQFEATDGLTTSAATITVDAIVVNQAPVVTMPPTLTLSGPTTTTITASATDDGYPTGATLTGTWTSLGGPAAVTFAPATVTGPEPGPLNATTQVTFPYPGTYALQLDVGDGQLDGVATTNVTVGAPVAALPGTAPTVSIGGVTDDQEVTKPVAILGTVSDGAWVLEMRLGGRDDVNTPWTVMASGTGAINAANIATFDPTLLLNGIYTVRLTSQNSVGSTATSVSLSVDARMKIGNFTLTFTDLTVQVGRLPLTITRTYDSRDKTLGDFGYGWKLGITDVRVEKSGKIGAYWIQQFIDQGLLAQFCLYPTQAASVAITFPSGRQYRFVPQASPQCQYQAPLTAADITWVSTSDPTDPTIQLVAEGSNSVTTNDTTSLNDGSTYTQLVTNALDDIYDPRDFTLTIEDGSVWHVNQDSGVSSVTTLQGDKLTITPAGILHSSGKQVTFTRDAQNRITTITDPAGNSMSYAFDASGDLASYDDRASNVTQFAYADDHYLTQIQDPLGRLPVRNDYDSSGRLISTTDATGAVVHYTPNLAANQEQVTDRLGHVTLYTYDDYGDITQKVDATGAVWNYTVDPRGNVLTTTDPLGRTTTSTFNGLDLPLTQTDALGHTTTNTYTFFKTLASTTDPLGHITTNNWDGLGRMIGSIDPLGNETHDTYDPNGGANLLASADALGNTTQYVYDSFNHVIQQTDPLGNQVTYTYDANGNKTTQSLNRNNYNGQGAPVQTTYAYDPNGRLLSTTTTSAFGASGTTSTTYTPTGKRATSTDADGRVTTYLYDALDRLITTEYPDGTITSQTYDAENHRISSTDANGNTTQYTYDQVGRLVRTTYADGSASSTVYDAAGQAIQNIDARGNVSWTAYDAAGRRISTTSPTGSTTTYAYDADGNQTTVTDALGHTTTTTYDADNHAVATTYADGNADATQYDPDGRVSLRIDTLGRITRYAYDTKGQLTSVTDALGHTTTYAYDQTGARVSQTDANRHTTDFIYDYVTGVETLRVLPDGTSQSHASDPAGQITQRIDYNGKKTTYAYDPRGKLLSRTYPDSSVVSFTYTPTGQRATETDARGTTTYGYDVRNRLVALTYPDGRKLTYGYDGAGNRTSITAKIGGNSLTTSTAYDASGRPMTVTDPLNRAYQMTYDADDGPATLSYPNGIQTTYAYDPRHRLTNLTTTQPSTNTTVASFAYTLNSEGERTQLVEADGTVRQYGYDSISRLTTETVTGSLAYANAFTYDSVGNRLTQTTTGSGAASVTYGYDSRDRLTTENNTTYGYDNDGNVTSKAGEASYAWDFENRLTEVTLNGGAVVGHVYDADGNRVQTSVTPSGGSATVDNYLVDTAGCPSCGGGGGLSQVVAESDGSGNITAVYVRDGDELLEVMRPGTSPGTWTTRFIHHDGLGSVRALTDETGTTTDARDYEAFGTKNVEAGGDPLTYGFAGEQFQSDSMLAYHRARWMDARVGRFEGMDPQDGLIRVPSTFHRYVYAADTPVNAVDPSGREYDMVSIGAAVVGFGILATTAVADTKISPGPDQRTSNWYVDVRSTPVDVSLLFDHLFLVVGEPGAAAGEQYETEYGAGASQGLFGSLSPGSLGGNGFSNQFAYGPIQAYASLYHGPPNQAPDWDTDAPRVQVASGQSQVEQANQCFVDAMNDINAAKITYDPLDSNSNRYVRTLLQRCNLPLLTPGTNTPGFQQPPF